MLRTACSSCHQAKLVKQEQQAIDAQYEKKRKGAEVAQKMYVMSPCRMNPFMIAHYVLMSDCR